MGAIVKSDLVITVVTKVLIDDDNKSKDVISIIFRKFGGLHGSLIFYQKLQVLNKRINLTRLSKKKPESDHVTGMIIN